MTFAASHSQTGISAADVATTQYAIPLSLGGLTPKVIWADAISRTPVAGAGAGLGDLVVSHSFSTATKSRCLIMQSDHDAATTQCDTVIRNDRIVGSLSTAGVLNGSLALVSVGPDEVVVRIDTQFPADMQLHLFAIAGTDITDADIIEFTSINSVAGDQDVNTVGFTPTFLECLTSTVSVNTVVVDVRGAIGRATTNPIANQGIAIFCDDAAAASDTSVYAQDVESFLRHQTSNAVLKRGRVTAGIAGGFRITWDEVAATSIPYSVLALAGTFQVALASFLTQTDTTTDSATELTFNPVGGLTMSHCKAESASDTPQDTAELSLGMFTIFDETTSFQGAMGFIDVDAQDPTVTAVGYITDPSDGSQADYLNISTAGAVEGKMRLFDWLLTDVDHFLNHRMNDADPAQALVMLTAFGAAPAAAAVPLRSRRGMRRILLDEESVA